MNSSPVVGYSVTDLYYSKPSYCKRGYTNGELNTNPSIPDGGPDENRRNAKGDLKCEIYDSSYNINEQNQKDCPCTFNEHFGKILRQKKNTSDMELYKYQNTTSEYNLQIIRTINYSIGVGVICAYFVKIFNETNI
jgi:hypothetical protein